MTRDGCNAFCAGLPATTHVVQWGGADVWKVGGKVFAVVSTRDGRDAASLKASDIACGVLADAPGVRPAPYMASRGLPWLKVDLAGGLPEAAVRDLLTDSHAMVAAGLTRKARAALGLG